MEISPLTETEIKETPASTIKPSLKERILGINRLFLFTVIIPTAVAIIYYGFIASDIYVSESRFVVRSPQKQQSVMGLGSLLQNAGFSRSQDDTYTVHDFMQSRDALIKLNNKFSLNKVLSNPHIDIFNRFNSFGIDGSFEALYKYYKKILSIELDPSSSISVLKVSAFTAEDSYRINHMLLEMGESLINTLNERGRRDMVDFATAEVNSAEKMVKEAGEALSNYRKNNAVFDPDRQTAMQFQQISKLQDELIISKTQLAQILAFTPNNPQIPALKKRVETLSLEIENEKNKVTGTGASLTNKAAEFERLSLNRMFADKQLASSLSSLEQARNEAVRKQLYIDRIVQPGRQDVALEPNRLRNIFVTFVLGLITWGILTMLVAGIREHQD